MSPLMQRFENLSSAYVYLLGSRYLTTYYLYLENTLVDSYVRVSPDNLKYLDVT